METEILKPEEDSIEIGRVRITYKQSGNVESASFTPTIKVEFDNKLLTQISGIKSSTNINSIKDMSESVFASWFTRINSIELADRNLFRIVSKVEKCNKYPDDSVRECEMIFSFERIKPVTPKI